MTDSQRRVLVGRLLAGFTPVRARGVPLRVNDPPPEARLAAEEAYAAALAAALDAGLYSEDEAAALAGWDGVRQARLDQSLQDLDGLKIDVYRNFYDPPARDAARARLAACRRLVAELSAERDALFGQTAHAAAAAQKARVACGLSLTDPAGKPALGPDPALWDADLVDEAVAQAAAARPSEADLREAARTAPWQGYWAAGSPNPFGVPAARLGDDRLALINFSLMYDRVREAQDRPPRDVVEDDDALDGWLALRRREDPSEKERVGRMLFTNEKIAGATEVFKFVSSPEQAALVSSLNSPQAARELKAREAQIARDGFVEEHQLADVRRGLEARAEEARRG